MSSYSSASSSLCAAWSSCSSAGSTGVYTVSWPGPSGSYGPGGGGGTRTQGHDHGRGAGAGWGPWASTYTAAQVTVTGCPWDGSPWVGPGGNGWGGWGDWGAGWAWSTRAGSVVVTETVTRTDGSVAVSTGLERVAEAVSGSVTSTTTLSGLSGSSSAAGTATAAAAATGSSSSSSAPGAAGSGGVGRGVVVAGVLVGGLVGVMAVL